MKRCLTISIAITLCSACSASDSTKAPPDVDLPDAGQPDAAPTAPVTLLDWYDGTAELPDGESVEVEIRFVEPGDGRALLRVGELDDAWGYGANFEVDGGRVSVETSPARCASSCPNGALALEGRADGDGLEFTTVTAADGGESPFVALRVVPHDGVKPVLNPVVDFTYDPAPVAGVYPGIVYALSDTAAVNGACTLEIDPDPLRAAAFDCFDLSGIDDAGALLYDEERAILNVLVGPDDGRLLLVAELSAAHDGDIDGVLAELDLGEVAIAPDEVPHDALVGLVSMREDGTR